MAFGGTVVTAVLGPAVHAAIAVIVPKIPCVTRSDQLTAAPAGDGAGLDEWPVVVTQRPVIGAIAALRGGATAAPECSPAVGTPELIAIDAQLCRKSCGVIFCTLARFTAPANHPSSDFGQYEMVPPRSTLLPGQLKPACPSTAHTAGSTPR